MDAGMLTSPPLLYVVLAVALLVAALLGWLFLSVRRTRRERAELRARYGDEFDRAVSEHGNRRAAVADLRAREDERRLLSLRELNAADLDIVRRHMAAAQYRFVDDPREALERVERIMTEVLRAKGYPVAHDRRQTARLFSVDHPDHAGSVRAVLGDGAAGDIEDLRIRFVKARKTIADVTGLGRIVDEDAGQTPIDLRVEHNLDAPLASKSSSTS